jgi:hypothetical protein
MIAQAPITNIVIDSPLRFPQCTPMLTADHLREELIRQLNHGQLTGADVARELSIAPARVTEMKRRTRKVQQEEMLNLAKLLGLEQSGESPRLVEKVFEIRNMGKVAQGVWLEESPFGDDPDEVEYVPYDRMMGDPAPTDLFALTPEGTSMNLAFLPGTQLICRRIDFGDGGAEPGEYVIVERTAHDLVEMTCKLLEIDKEGVFWLCCESSDPKFEGQRWRIGRPSEDHHDDQETRIVAKVVRSVRNHEKRW